MVDAVLDLMRAYWLVPVALSGLGMLSALGYVVWKARN